MAISIISSPGDNVPVHSHCLEWAFSSSDVGVAPIVKSVGYYLKTVAGQRITENEVITPYEAGAIIRVDFAGSVLGYLRTIIPQVDTGASESDPTISLSVIMVYFEVTTDTESCITTTGAEAETDPVLCWNGAMQVYEQNNVTLPILLNHIPDKIRLCSNGRAFMWVLGSMGNATYTLNGGFSLGAIGSPFQANVLPLSYHGFFPGAPPPNIASMEISMPALNRTVTVEYMECCESKCVNMMFLDPLGGRGMMSFEELDELGFSAEGGEVVMHQSCDIKKSLERAGKNIINKSGREYIFLIAETEDNPADFERMKAFLGSAGYHVQRDDLSGGIKFQKFMLEVGNVIYFKSEGRIELRLQGYYTSPYKTQKIDI